MENFRWESTVGGQKGLELIFNFCPLRLNEIAIAVSQYQYRELQSLKREGKLSNFLIKQSSGFFKSIKLW
ncbi:hypothetical protein B6N58_00785 [Legionella micdadei]|nr:hypothetical protein B6N58_00785 [Legionella micdadei]